MASFVEFLKTGQLERLHCGMSKDEVRDLLGEPEAVSPQRQSSNLEIWVAGANLLSIVRGGKSVAGVHRLFISILMTINLPGFQGLAGWWPTGETTFEEFRDFLDRFGYPSRWRRRLRGPINIWFWHPVFASLLMKAGCTASATLCGVSPN